MLNNKKSVGSYVVTECSRCNNNMNHVITALNPDSSIAQVKCLVCGSIHKPKNTKTTRVLGTTKKIEKVKSAPSYSLLNQAKEGASNKVPINYTISTNFKKNTLIQHTQMGEGVVLNVFDNKIEVLFAEGKKVLVHNKG